MRTRLLAPLLVATVITFGGCGDDSEDTGDDGGTDPTQSTSIEGPTNNNESDAPAGGSGAGGGGVENEGGADDSGTNDDY